MLNDFIALIYPHLCAGCVKPLYHHEQAICTHCKFHLPKTGFYNDQENPVNKIFWGRVNVEFATSYFYFTKGGKVQQLIHQLKYKGQKEVGTQVGKLMGVELHGAERFQTVDTVIPVPLHPKRLRKRGYNQSDFIAKGVAEGMAIDYNSEVLLRQKANTTQTKKSHYERWQNVESIFKVNNHKQFSGKHFLLVDDVVTTGSTLEACARALLEVPHSKVTIATLAYTQ